MTGQPWVQKKYWTPEEDAYLKRLIAQGMTDRQIAVHLGRSKNTIIGRRHRLKLACNPITGEERADMGAKRLAMWRAAAKKRDRAKAASVVPLPPTPKPAPKNHNPSGMTVVRLADAKRNSGKPPVAPLPKLAPFQGTVSVADIDWNGCRYIGERPETITIDTPIYCGARTRPGKSWCDYPLPRVFSQSRVG